MKLDHPDIDYDEVCRLAKGDTVAFDSLYHKYAPLLYNFSIKYLKSAADAEDVVQDVFSSVWEHRNDLKPDMSFKGYLFTISFNIVRKHFNRLARENAYKDDLIRLLLAEENNLDTVIDYKSLLEKVEAVIAAMPEKRRIIFIKRKYDGLAVKQIALQLGISPNTVENQLSAAQKTLKEEMAKFKLMGLLYFALFLAL